MYKLNKTKNEIKLKFILSGNFKTFQNPEIEIKAANWFSFSA